VDSVRTPWLRLMRLWRLVPAVWLGVLLCVALIATPAPFATLEPALAGRVVGHIFAREAPLSLLLAMLVLMMGRREAAARHEAGQGSQFSGEMLMAVLVLLCTVFGYYVLQPMMAAARAGVVQPLNFGQLHGLSFGLFGLKMVFVAVLAWWRSR